MKKVNLNSGLITIEDHQNKSNDGTSVKISGKGTYYLSALKKGLKEGTLTSAEESKVKDVVKYLAYNRFMKCFFVGSKRFEDNDILTGIKAITFPKNWEQRVFELMPKAQMESDHKPEKEAKEAKPKVNPAKNKTKGLTADQKKVINQLAEKLIDSGYGDKSEIPANSIKIINSLAEKNGFKSSDVFQVFNDLIPEETEEEDLDSLEL